MLIGVSMMPMGGWNVASLASASPSPGGRTRGVTATLQSGSHSVKQTKEGGGGMGIGCQLTGTHAYCPLSCLPALHLTTYSISLRPPGHSDPRLCVAPVNSTVMTAVVLTS